MFEYPTRVRAVLGAVIGVNLLLAAGAVAGLMPHRLSAETVAAATSVGQEAPAAPEAEAPAPADSEPAPAPVATSAVTAPPAPAPVRTVTTAAPDPTPAPTPAPTAAPATTAAPKAPTRLKPTSAQVQAGIAQLKARQPLINITESQARQFGNQVCGAFDAGQSYSQIRSQAMQAASGASMLFQISTADADFAIRTAVSLFCPTYASKLP